MPSATHRATDVSNWWYRVGRCRGTGRALPVSRYAYRSEGRLLEKVDLSGNRSGRSIRQNHRYAKFKCTSSLSRRSLIAARKKLVEQCVTIDIQILWSVVVLGVQLLRALSTAFKDAALKISDGVPSLHAMIRDRADFLAV